MRSLGGALDVVSFDHDISCLVNGVDLEHKVYTFSGVRGKS